ncbi:hypothetical protein DL96DRAFT_1549637 [Flagelloscypha sp. PMI_526]|nr:hypothetical protein DL96DRAFT_1549637 [Flagelloscypha sp. PMI_526]
MEEANSQPHRKYHYKNYCREGTERRIGRRKADKRRANENKSDSNGKLGQRNGEVWIKLGRDDGSWKTPRTQWGIATDPSSSSSSAMATEEDLDRAVAELIVKEAKRKAEKYRETGVKAFLRDNFNDTNAPRANKRFLSSIIKSTDEHNKAVLKSQAESAREREEREREEDERRRRRDRKRRHRDHERSRSRDRRKRRRKSKERNKSDTEEEFHLSWDRWDGRDVSEQRDEGKEHNRDWENWRPPPREPNLELDTPKSKSRHRRRKHRSLSPWTLRLHRHKTPPPTPPPAPSPPPPPLPSKMDRYFHEDYDPRLDVERMEAPTIPSSGLISDAEFAGWDAMLDALRAREDRKKYGASGPPSTSAGVAPNLMDVKYSKKGSVREWDMGKETPT